MASPAKPAEKFGYLRVFHFEPGRKLVAEDSEIRKNVVLFNSQMVLEKEPLNLLLRNIAVRIVFAQTQSV